MEQRFKFIETYLEGTSTFSQLCHRFGISRRIGYKWVKRFVEEGRLGLADRSRAPHHTPHALCESQRKLILGIKCDHMDWGPNKIVIWLNQTYPDVVWPVTSTVGELLKQYDLVKKRRKRQRIEPYTQPFGECGAPNDSWSIDYKGQFKTQDGHLCYPLTLSDNFSRYLLACDGYERISGERVKEVMEAVFKEYGLPKVIRSDNGTPFASKGLGALTYLSVWWMKLGIVHERIRPGHPEENGRHERMHRTLKERTIRPAKATMLEQRVAFKAFIQEYNEERPHEGLNNQRPGWVHRVSERVYPGYLSEAEYEKDYETRRVRENGTMKWKGKEVYVTDALKGEEIGLLEKGDGEWEVYYYKKKLGVFKEEGMKIEGRME
jgi:transposase InsO family protein